MLLEREEKAIQTKKLKNNKMKKDDNKTKLSAVK